MAPDITKKIYTWNENWFVCAYESPWGIFEKYKYANAISSNEIFKTFFHKEVRRNLLILSEFDESQSKLILGVNLKEVNRNNIDKFVRIFYRGEVAGEFIHNNVHFCTECMLYGYHSFLHQLFYVNECPYHLKKLSDRCPKCNHTIPYSISHNWSKAPFICKCGHTFFEGDADYSFIRKWHIAEKFKLQSESILKLINLTEQQNFFLVTQVSHCNFTSFSLK